MSLSHQSNVEDYSVYNDRMDRSMMDKLFFVDKVDDPDLLVDFGCAHGKLCNVLLKFFGDSDIVGYDISNEMLEKAREKSSGSLSFTSEWSQIDSSINESETSVLILSSVIHEIYHYSDLDEIDKFWEQVWNSGFDMIVLRDMIPSKSIDRKPPMEKVRKIYSKYGGTKELQDFENSWGSIETSHKQLVHFLLKYRYTEPNWAREVKENYFPFYVEDLLGEIPDKYSILFHHHFVLPYIRKEVRKDFNIELEDPTHFKLIIEKNQR